MISATHTLGNSLIQHSLYILCFLFFFFCDHEDMVQMIFVQNLSLGALVALQELNRLAGVDKTCNFELVRFILTQICFHVWTTL